MFVFVLNGRVKHDVDDGLALLRAEAGAPDDQR